MAKSKSTQLVVARRIAGLIRKNDVSGAETELVAYADGQGDKALVEVLDGIPSKNLVAFVREFDASKPSIATWAITPEQFARAVVYEPLFGEANHSHLKGMVNGVVFREGADSAAFLRAILSQEGGAGVLADYLLEHAEQVVHFRVFGTFDLDDDTMATKAEIMDADWMELTWLLRFETTEDAFDDVLNGLRERSSNLARTEALAEREMEARLSRIESLSADGLQPNDDGEEPSGKRAEETAI